MVLKLVGIKHEDATNFGLRCGSWWNVQEKPLLYAGILVSPKYRHSNLFELGLRLMLKIFAS